MEIILKLLWLLLLAPIVFLLIPFLYRSLRNRLIVSFINAFVLMVLTVFLFNQPGWRWNEQAELSELAHKSNPGAYRFIRENFILIDNSYDKVLVKSEDDDEDAPPGTAITNRDSLISFLKLANKHINNVDLIVCDIGFDISTDKDSLLAAEFLNIAAKDKLLLSINGQPYSNANLLLLDEKIYGNISEEGNEELFISHHIKRNKYYSLPYKLYHELNKIKTGKPFFFNLLFWEHKADSSFFATTTFYPELTLTDEKLLITGYTSAEQDGADIRSDTGYESETRDYFSLSEPLSEYDQVMFTENLKQRKEKKYRNVLFIGTFKSPNEDIHQTMHGQLHGPTILLSIFYSLQKGQHHIGINFLLLLLGGYFVVTFTLITTCLRKHHKKLHRSTTHNRNVLLQTGKLLLEFIFIEEIHLLLLVLFVLLIKSITGQWVNILSLVIYFGVLNICLKFGVEKMLPQKT